MARSPSKHIDWKKAERLFKQGLLSNVEIAQECNAKSEGSIRAMAQKKGWKRDLTQEMRAKTRTKLVENLASYSSPEAALQGLESMADEALIEQASRTQVTVVREHQQTLKQGHSLTLRMLSELDDTTAYKGELQALISSSVAPQRQEALRRAISLSARAATMRELATAARIWVTLERQAFNIVDETKNPQPNNVDDNKSAEELRAEILSDAKRLGLDVDLSRGNGNDSNASSNGRGLAPHQTNGKVH